MYPNLSFFGLINWHEELQLIYVESGHVIIKTLFTSRKLHQGQACFIGKNVAHQVVSDKDSVYSSILFDQRLVMFMTTETKEFIDNFLENEQHSLIIIDEASDFDRKILRQLEQLLRLGIPQSSKEFYRIQLILSEVMLYLSEERKEQIYDINKSRRLETMLHYIDEHYAEPLSLQDLAQSAHISQTECQRQFQTFFETTPHQYLIRYRLEKAKILIERSDLNLTEIASRTGFSHGSHFGKLFKGRFGVTPRSYRSQMKKVKIR